MRLFLALVVLILALGCGKKTEPEAAAGPSVSADLVDIVVLRRDSDNLSEEAAFRGVLLITNRYEGEIVLQRVEYGARVGKKELPGAIEQLDVTVPPGATTELSLSSVFGWKDEAPMTFERGAVHGTLYYLGPKGKIRALPFTLSGELQIRGD